MSDTIPSTPMNNGEFQTQGQETHSALFANLVFQHSSMAMMLMGQVPNPETGKATKDLEAAKMFIDQLEMVETKTRGNLTKEEEKLLKQTLMALRLGFVEAFEQEQKGGEKPAEKAGNQAQAQPSETSTSPSSGPSSGATAPQEESHKKFTKKY